MGVWTLRDCLPTSWSSPWPSIHLMLASRASLTSLSFHSDWNLGYALVGTCTSSQESRMKWESDILEAAVGLNLTTSEPALKNYWWRGGAGQLLAVKNICHGLGV